MAIFQVATNTPSKPELMAAWITTQPWAPSQAASLKVVGSYHLEDPEGEIGMQGHLLDVDGVIFHVPLTYRNEPEAGMDDAFIATMEHSVLGTRYVYDGLRDDHFISVFAGVAACGYGQALGFARVDGRWQAWPETAKLHGHGRVDGRVVVDRFEQVDSGAHNLVLRNGSIELNIGRRPEPREIPDIGITVSLPVLPTPLVLATVTQLKQP